MATSTPLPSRPTEEDNPGQNRIEDLTDREFNHDEYERRHGIAAGDPSDPRGGMDEEEYDDQTEPAGDPSDPRSDNLGPENLSAAEEVTSSQQYEQKVGKGYKKQPDKPGFIRRQLGRRNRIFLIGGTATTITVIAIVIFLSLLPFKIMHIMNNLQSHFFSTSENAMQTETNALFSNYLRKYVMPALKNCPTNVNRTCNPITQGSLVSQLYKGWRNAHFEEKLATNYGLQFKYNKNSGHYYLSAPGLSGDGLDLGTENTGFAKSSESLDEFIARTKDDPQFQRVSRSQLRAAVNDSINRETSWKKVMYRYKVGRLLEKKYGFKRCIFACDTRDNFADWKDNKLRAAKLILAERVLLPRSESLYLVIGCVLTDSCDPSHRTVPDGGINGEPETPVEKELRVALDQLALEETGKYADVLAHSSGILKDGYTKYIAKQVAKKLATTFGGDAAAAESAEKITGSLIPIVGWVNTSSSVIGTLEKSPTKIKALAYMTNAAGMVSAFATYRTYTDEIKTGHVDGELIGSMTDALGPGNNDSTGGTATAEQSPLYGYLIGDDIDNSGNAVSRAFGNTALAASSTPAYLCNNGKPVPAGKLICPEEVLGGADLPIVNAIDEILKDLGPLKDLADFWNSTAGKPIRAAVNAFSTITSFFLSHIPGFDKLVSLITAAAEPVIKAFTDWLIPNPFSDNASGGRTFDLAAGGADQLNSDYSQNALGGRKLTQQQAAAILAEQAQQNYQAYRSESLLARITDTDSNYSVVSKLAMSMPDSAKSASGSITAALFTNPFAKISGIFAPLFSLGHAQAAASTFPDPFGISQYGYPADDPGLAAANQDPETYWAQNCSSDGTTLDWSVGDNAKWIDSATVDPDTGLPEDDSTNPCLLIEAAVGSSGALYDSGLLTSDDLGSTSSSTTTTSTTPVSANAQQLAQQILNNKNIQLTGRLVLQDIQDAANGQPGTAGAMTSAAILQLILSVGQKYTVVVSAIQSGGTGHCNNTPKSSCPNDPHYNGDAVDFSTLDGVALTGRDSGSLSIMNVAFGVLPTGSGLGQSQCGATPTLPSGWSTFQDTCDHLHVQVPAGTP